MESLCKPGSAVTIRFVQFLVLGDIHANFHALEAVLGDAEGKFDQIVCLGDLVGYNAQPESVIAWTRANCTSVVRGNHDKAIAGIDSLEWFNEIAQAAARWTIAKLNADELSYLRNLDKGPLTLSSFHICHGSPRDEDEYVTTPGEAALSFAQPESSLTFFGHTHLQGGFFSKYNRVGAIASVPRSESESILALEPDVVYLVNPGSVGQPRDGDPRAAYALYDPERGLVTFRRVAYAIRKTAEEIMEAGLPDVLAFRLFQGM